MRLSIALASGIIIGGSIHISTLILLVLFLALFAIALRINHVYSYRLSPFFGVMVHLLFVLTGLIVFRIYNQKPQFFDSGTYVATVLETPQEKPNSWKSEIKITGCIQNKVFYNTSEKVIVYFEKDTITPNLVPGNVILFNSVPQFIRNNGNPYEFDYRKYLERKKIYRQAFLPENNWWLTDLKCSFSLKVRSEKLREKLLQIYRRQNLGVNELEILSALTLGYKRELDPETKQVFSAAGAMHVLAVSGLHVGILFWVISLLFGFLKKLKGGRGIFVMASLVCIWLYAFITGLSPSVLRAATMVSMFIIGDNLKRRINIYNSLAASALLILLINPNNLFEVGFQLSYAAVFGIVYLQPKLVTLYTSKYLIIRYIWILVTVSLAAQITTLPFTLYYFNQFPTWFWLTNILIIPAVKLLIPLGIGLLILGNVPFVPIILSTIVDKIIHITYAILQRIEGLPFSTLEIPVDKISLPFVFLILFSVLVLLESRRPFWIKSALAGVVLLMFISCAASLINSGRAVFIVYNHPENTILHLATGKTNYVVSEFPVAEKNYESQMIHNTVRGMKLGQPRFLLTDTTFRDQNFLIKNGIILFQGKVITVRKNIAGAEQTILPDYVVNPEPDFGFSRVKRCKPVFITNKSYIHKNQPDTVRWHRLPLEGGFLAEW